MQTRDQRYATKIYTQVQEIKQQEKAERDKYGSMAHKLPVLIRTAGLAQALAFVAARGSGAQKMLLRHLAEVVEAGDQDELLQRSRSANLVDYMRLTQQVMDALVWYKRFAQSVLDVDASQDAGVTR